MMYERLQCSDEEKEKRRRITDICCKEGRVLVVGRGGGGGCRAKQNVSKQVKLYLYLVKEARQ